MLRLLLSSVLACLTWAPTSVVAARQIDPALLRPNLIEVTPGRRLHFACIGEGSPTIIFEQGGEGWIANWREIQSEAASISRTCFYDRAGFGLSDPPVEPVTALEVTNHLHRLLNAAGIEQPGVLVGHSIGGFYASVYANRFPEQVSGMVLIEPGFDGQFAPSSAKQRRLEQRAMRAGEEGLRRCAELARQKTLSAEQTHGCFGLPAGLSAEENAYLVRMLTRPAWYEAVLSQSESFFPSGEDLDSLSWRQERVTRRDFAELPLVVLTAENAPREGVQDDETYAESAQHWKNGHRRLAGRSVRGEWIEVPRSGHFVQLDRPDVVLEAIRRVVRQAKSQRGP